MKRRKAETLAESIMSLAAFGVIMAGVCDFMSNQINFIAWTKHRDELMYNQEWLLSNAQWLLDNDLISQLENNHKKDVIAGNKTTYPNNDQVKFNIKGEIKDVEYVEENIVSFDWDHEDKKLITKNAVTSISISTDIDPDP
ncbi:MAG: hypothetical protein SPL10_01375 [Synergistales bacterium]|nr:hypothetical protein [Synergistales bacterium]MDY6400689.1 hypothetical protein [Synergistales bacterium]MDY6405036.1 hypothetical protein [Synergistales bacterium]MDY6410107.1 hypothetical protein [Synergistales bacterium]MDY6413795.1 hypothetical protein [Synergistales bacterium]